MQTVPETSSCGRLPVGGTRRRVVGLPTGTDGWRMVERRNDTTDPGPPPTTDPGPEPEPASSSFEDDGRPPVDDPVVHQLLGGLEAPRFPRPVEVSETDGELVARYAAGPHDVPAKNPTPAHQPSVLFGVTVELPILRAPDPTVPLALERSQNDTPSTSARSRLADTASMVLPRPRRLPWVVLAGATLIALVVVLVAVLRSRSGSNDATSPSATSAVPSPTSAPTATTMPLATSPTAAVAPLGTAQTMPYASVTSRPEPRSAPVPRVTTPRAPPPTTSAVPPSPKTDREL